jgi:hypothetical protein
MRNLGDLIASENGWRHLEMHGVLNSVEAFVERLRPPPDAGLADHVGAAPGTPLVYAAHQLMVDYPESVVAKLRAADQLGERSGVDAVLLWLDMDRAGADKMATGSVIRGRGGGLQIRLASRRHDDASSGSSSASFSARRSSAEVSVGWGSSPSVTEITPPPRLAAFRRRA